jgi:hypothetical protein
MSFCVGSEYHGLFGVNDYTHLLPGFLSGDGYFTTFEFWASHGQYRSPRAFRIGTEKRPRRKERFWTHAKSPECESTAWEQNSGVPVE